MRMWMVRSEGGSLYDALRERGMASFGWSRLTPMPRQDLGTSN